MGSSADATTCGTGLGKQPELIVSFLVLAFFPSRELQQSGLCRTFSSSSG